jgi:hypothetical protein
LVKLLHLPRRTRELAVQLDASGIRMPDVLSNISVPSTLRIEHTITRKPPPVPHNITAVMKDSRGCSIYGNPAYVSGGSSSVRLPLPAGYLFLYDPEKGAYLPVYEIPLELRWSQ